MKYLNALFALALIALPALADDRPTEIEGSYVAPEYGADNLAVGHDASARIASAELEFSFGATMRVGKSEQRVGAEFIGSVDGPSAFRQVRVQVGDAWLGEASLVPGLLTMDRKTTFVRLGAARIRIGCVPSGKFVANEPWTVWHHLDVDIEKARVTLNHNGMVNPGSIILRMRIALDVRVWSGWAKDLRVVYSKKIFEAYTFTSMMAAVGILDGYAAFRSSPVTAFVRVRDATRINTLMSGKSPESPQASPVTEFNWDYGPGGLFLYLDPDIYAA